MWFHYFRGQFLYPEDGSSTFLESGGNDEANYMALHSRRQQSSG
jgi:hypothetical protein